MFIMQNCSMNWNDLKYFIALYRYGSLSQAGSSLKVNSTTVARRIRQLEQDLGSTLFIRQHNRFLPTDEADAILALAETFEEQAANIAQRLDSRNQSLQGVIRITSVSTFINGYLLLRLSEFKALYPGIQVELIADSQQLSLTRREADLAIRMGRPQSGNLVISKLTDLNYAVFGKKGDVVQSDLESYPWVTLEESYSQLPEAVWQQSHYGSADVALSVNVGLGSVEAVTQGIGLAYLPCFLGRKYQLEQLSSSSPTRQLWLLQHPELRELQRLRVFTDWLRECLSEDYGLFL
ncbi:LysR family transcriptional regulator [Amphritea japonica]|uniref:LysR family transcriptional regulator n=1 Tax=Amphritea japonica ATCC BAA-1530 TaxID=1278309 RepID=A0A7R6P629_9GAMM|nr:LysR family transcriptional regulator [Amphritea japonica]BBB26649.1 LysR family transcriptional regulator [Amphritea japonica ATCC BAA-1530]